MPGSPKLLKAGIVLVDPNSGKVMRVIALQYNPQSLTRSIQPQWYEPNKEKSSPDVRLQFKGPAVETIKLEAEIDATDKKEKGDPKDKPHEVGIHPELAALEMLVYPSSLQLKEHNRLAAQGIMQIAGMKSLLTVFVWSTHRVAPVRITEYSVNEQFFDGNLNPIQAKVSLGMQVLTVDDLGFDHRAGELFMAYLERREALAKRGLQGGFEMLGIDRSRF
jgi:hypothetical protein